jgi:hypothetical protein
MYYAKACAALAYPNDHPSPITILATPSARLA